MPQGRNDRRYFLGGHDLEMLAIGNLVASVLGHRAVCDKQLKWGARASAYVEDVRTTLAEGSVPVLVELEPDLPEDIPPGALLMVDHHGERAGKEKPSALRQVFDLLELPASAWTREMSLIEANDVDHIRGLVAAGATKVEVAEIRRRDRAAQGITPEVERLSREAVSRAKRRGALTVVETELPTSSAIGDFMHVELDGPGADNMLVLMPRSLAFFGDGSVIADLADVPGSWRGGALPERGFWGVNEQRREAREALVKRISVRLA